MQCNICGSEVEKIKNFGVQPLANAFESEEDSDRYHFELIVGKCELCHMIQLIDPPKPEVLFTGRYPYLTGNQQPMVDHFAETAQTIKEMFDPESILEIGCNDGTFLNHFREIRHLGLEPSFGPCKVAQDTGLDVWSKALDFRALHEIKPGDFDIIYAANTMCHIGDLREAIVCIDSLLTEKGTFIFEDPYFPPIISANQLDQFYDEHAYYFSLTSLTLLLKQFGLFINEVELFPGVHGGVMRYYVSRREDVSNDVLTFSRVEHEAGLDDLDVVKALFRLADQNLLDLKELVFSLDRLGVEVVGYGATSKSTMLLNYLNLPLQRIYDNSPSKIGKYSPGRRIPIVSTDEFQKDQPEYTVLFAWNYQDYILEKEEGYGGHWITYIPHVRVL